MSIAKHTIGALLFVAATAHATTVNSLCASIGELAESIMRARQSGASVTRMLETAQGNKIAEALVMDAFNTSRFTSQPFIDRAAEEFRERAEVQCLRTLKSKGTV